MSISLIISNPVDNEQRQINIPVATESFFNNHWLPATRILKLTLIPMFSFGFEIGEEELPDVLAELKALKSWAAEQNQSTETHQILDRADRLLQELPKIVSSQIKVFIG